MNINTLYALMLSIPIYSQTIIVPNVKAKELRQSLNKETDTLLLESAHTIESVTLSSNNHREFVMPNTKTAQLPLHLLPVGNYTAVVITNRKIIVFNILKNNKLNKLKS